MDQGVQLAFSSVGIDDVSFGMPTFTDGWKQLIITGSSQRAITSGQYANQGGRLILNVKCVADPSGQDVGKEHIIGLNLWHPVPETKQRADEEMASIIRAIFGGDRQINSTAELYNQPFNALAVTQTPAKTPQYPDPKPQTNWRGYRDRNNNEVKAGGNGGGMGGNQMPNFNQQPQQNQQQNNGNWGGGNLNQQQQPPQGGNPQGWGNGNQQQPQQNTQQGGWGNNGAPQGGNASPPNSAPQNGGWGAPGGANAASPSNQNQQPNAGWGNNGQPQQNQQPQQSGWAPQGGGNGNGGGWG